ncbi:hypothetical protein ACLOJK_004611 [Asimina triloba]
MVEIVGQWRCSAVFGLNLLLSSVHEGETTVFDGDTVPCTMVAVGIGLPLWLQKSARDAPDLAIAALFCQSLQPDLPIGRRGFAAVELASMDAVRGEEGVVHHAASRTWLDLPLKRPDFKSEYGWKSYR